MKEELSERKWKKVCEPEYRFNMEGTKWDIFCCALHLFAEYDYSSISMRQIAEELGLRASSIYNHFSSKDEILSMQYKFLKHYSTIYLMDLDELLLMAEKDPPREVLKKVHYYYPDPIQDMMAKLILICSKQMRQDSRADQILKELLIDQTDRYITTILEHMLQLGRIEPLDIEAFVGLVINNYYGSSMRMYSSHPVDGELWIRSFHMLIDTVVPKNN